MRASFTRAAGRAHSVIGLALLLAALLVPLGGTDAEAYVPLDWASPFPADFSPGMEPDGAINAVACASQSLCVAGDLYGRILVSSDPSGGAAKWAPPLDVAPAGQTDGPGVSGVLAVQCPTASLCVGVDARGDILYSTDPTGGAAAWHVDAADTGTPSGWLGPAPFADLSCTATPSLVCVAVDQAGQVFTSTHPGDGGSSWSVQQDGADGTVGMSSVSCPTSDLCLIATSNGISRSKDPRDGATATWSTPAGPPVSRVSCPSASLCEALNGGQVYTSTDPNAIGDPTWSDPVVVEGEGGGNLESLTCSSQGASSICVAGNSAQAFDVTTDPADGTNATWTTDFNAPVDGGESGPFQPHWTGYSFGLACPTISFCVAGTNTGDVITSASPAAPDQWQASWVDALGEFSAFSCATTSVCIAGDYSGNVLYSSDPGGGSGAWPRTNLDAAANVPQDPISGVACAVSPSTLCTAVDEAGDVFTSTDPANGAWSLTGPLDVPNTSSVLVFHAISCPSSSLCVAVDDQGDVVWSTDPTGGSGAWHIVNVPNQGGWWAIDCASTSFCVIGGQNGKIAVSTNPTGASNAWSVAFVDQSVAWTDPATGVDYYPRITTVTCPTTTFCAIGDLLGEILASDNPGGGAGAWPLTGQTPYSGIAFNPRVGMTSLACASETLCVGSDEIGRFMTSVAPTANAWTPSKDDPVGATTNRGFVRCPSTSRCYFADMYGNLMTASPDPTPAELTVSPFGSGSGSVSDGNGFTCASADGWCTHRYADGATVSLTASPADHSTFNSWTSGPCDGSTNPVCVVQMNGDQTAEPRFEVIQHMLSVAIGGTGSGTVSGGGIACPTDCSAQEDEGSTVELTAEGTNGSTFSHWTGDCAGSTPTCDVSMSQARSVTAVFDPPADTTAPTITINTPVDNHHYAQGAVVNANYSCTDEQGGSGVASCAGTVADGAAIDTSSSGAHGFTVTAHDVAGNVRMAGVTYYVDAPVDATAPDIQVTSPQADAHYALNAVVQAFYSCSDQGGSGLASCTGTVANGSPIDTSTAGVHAFRVDAADNAGNPAGVFFTYTVDPPGSTASGGGSPTTTSGTAGTTVTGPTGGLSGPTGPPGPTSPGSPAADSGSSLVNELSGSLTTQTSAGAALSTGGFAGSITSPAGTAAVTDSTGGASAVRVARAAKAIVVAKVKKVFTTTGKHRFLVKLTPAGRKLLRHGKGLKLTEKIVFTPKAGGNPVTIVKSFRLKK